MDYSNYRLDLLTASEQQELQNLYDIDDVTGATLTQIQPQSHSFALSSLIRAHQLLQDLTQQYSLDDLSAPELTAAYGLNMSDITNQAVVARALYYNGHLATADIPVVTDAQFFPWYTLDDQTLQATAAANCIQGASRAEIVRKALAPAASAEPYPYEHDSFLPADQMFRNLVVYQPQVNHAFYRLSGYVPQIKPSPLLPPKFRGQFTSNFPQDLIPTMDGITDHFVEDIRLSARQSDSPCSPMEFWQRNSQWIQEEAQRQGVSVHDIIWQNAKWATRFRPSWGKFLIQQIFPNPRGKKWLDISAGWGDRLITAISLDMDYHGFDPNTALQPGHSAMIAQFGSPARHRVTYEPFETAVLTDKYDVVLSSPPFFDLELYADSPEQSVAKYPQFQLWKEQFLFRSLSVAWTALNPGGYLMIHISEGPRTPFIDEMMAYVRSLPHSQYLGVIGVVGERGRSSPVWVWHKTV